MSVQPSVSHISQGFLNGVGKNRHVFEMHASTVLVEVEADEGEIRVVVPKGLENGLSGGHIGMIYVPCYVSNYETFIKLRAAVLAPIYSKTTI